MSFVYSTGIIPKLAQFGRECYLSYSAGLFLRGGFVPFVLFWHAHRVVRPNPNLAKKCELRSISLRCLNCNPRIPVRGKQSGGPSTLRFGDRRGRIRSHSGKPEEGNRKREWANPIQGKWGESHQPTSPYHLLVALGYNIL